MTIQEFNALKTKILNNQVKENLQFNTVYDINNNSYRVEDGGYTQIIVYDGWVYTCDFNNKITTKKIQKRVDK